MFANTLYATTCKTYGHLQHRSNCIPFRITKVGANFSYELQRLDQCFIPCRSGLLRLTFIFSLTPFPIVLIGHPRKIVTLSHTHAHTHAYACARTHTRIFTHSGYFNRFSLGRGIPQRKTTLTLSRSSELGLSRESGFEGSRVNRHLE